MSSKQASMKDKIKKAAVMTAAAVALGTGASVVALEPASASVSSCGGGRCTLYFSKSETRAISQFRAPAPTGVPTQIKAAYYAMAGAHAWFAGQYANRGWCSAFRLSIYPWESQGYYGYPCNWN